MPPTPLKKKKKKTQQNMFLGPQISLHLLGRAEDLMQSTERLSVKCPLPENNAHDVRLLVLQKRSKMKKIICMDRFPIY